MMLESTLAWEVCKMNDNNSQRKPVAEGLPELCFAMLPTTGELIFIKRVELGY